MGASQSSDELNARTPSHSVSDPLHGDLTGWKILSIAPNSPCSHTGLVAYFSLLTHLNGLRLSEDQRQLLEAIQEDRPCQLTVYALASRQLLTITVTPSRSWSLSPTSSLLGLVIRHDDSTDFTLESIHILTVTPNSPADRAGLQSDDYLLGTPTLAFKAFDQLDYFLETSNCQQATIYVYNRQRHSVRRVTLRPDKNWSSDGNGESLGADTAVGFLHKLPLDEGWKAGLQPRMMMTSEWTVESRAEARTKSGVKDSEYDDSQVVMNLIVDDGRDDDVLVLSLAICIESDEVYWQQHRILQQQRQVMQSNHSHSHDHSQDHHGHSHQHTTHHSHDHNTVLTHTSTQQQAQLYTQPADESSQQLTAVQHAHSAQHAHSHGSEMCSHSHPHQPEHASINTPHSAHHALPPQAYQTMRQPLYQGQSIKYPAVSPQQSFGHATSQAREH